MRGYAQYPSGKRGTAVAVYCISDNGACAADMSICREDVPEATTDELLHELAEMWNRRVSPNINGENEMFGKLISAPIRLINAPARAAENLMGVEDDEERFLSQPLEELAKESDRAIDGDEQDGR